ncbi:hypothetical protein [Haladaptatus sp. CMAA 1911]|uniref:hypothetical protein n=1 Tax=unclassified Haladaptatus TaxID=2622732 RepID=UPI0037540F7C
MKRLNAGIPKEEHKYLQRIDNAPAFVASREVWDMMPDPKSNEDEREEENIRKVWVSFEIVANLLGYPIQDGRDSTPHADVLEEGDKKRGGLLVGQPSRRFAQSVTEST